MIGMFNGLGQWVQSTNQSQAAILGMLQALTAQLANLSAQTTTIQQSVSNPAAAAPATHVSSPSGTVHIKELCQFTGKATDIKTFLDEITNNIYLQQRTLPPNYEQSIFLLLYLADRNPKLWYQAI
ncbi:hypothetical protein PAXRUDRAFT_18221 [Paxillus rubicundulus Ve08.2h10]|uniref:Uncharacterized protein n=1 Tax=Paxillus rubicundulus Ve08.2h10 TaxID=930991 RepID=A0A0D0CZ05_9AGAM|nr:hypothetical protein PAXRUDRAFT_18221 [Paxillus rubicundulus Ve08.2h10]